MDGKDHSGVTTQGFWVRTTVVDLSLLLFPAIMPNASRPDDYSRRRVGMAVQRYGASIFKEKLRAEVNVGQGVSRLLVGQQHEQWERLIEEARGGLLGQVDFRTTDPAVCAAPGGYSPPSSHALV
jgi:hypothetical protein